MKRFPGAYRMPLEAKPIYLDKTDETLTRFIYEPAFPSTGSKQDIIASTPQENYISAVETIISLLKSAPQRGKIVFSRLILDHTPYTPEEIFNLLSQAYPEAFVFCFHDDNYGWWAGATPETLLSSHDGKITSMALAGTRSASACGEWDAKNREEHQMVVNFIANTFVSHGLIPQINATYTKKAGPVEHLCTPISAAMPETFDEKALWEFVHDLSPTPAVSGFPREEAVRQINKLELHPRSLYSGFLGSYRSVSDMDLFVNLRSMRLFDDGRCLLYSGGGITPSSVAQEEWFETQKKADTLLNVIKR